LISGLNIWIWIFVTWGVTKRCRSIQAEKEGEEILGAEYLSAIGALMYFANNSRPNIAFVVNCLIRDSASPTIRH
jgi:hypothetical protein